MKDVVVIEIEAPRERVAELFADPRNGAKWMENIKYEPLTGTPGMPGSTYRLIAKRAKMTFTATIVARDLPRETRLMLDAPTVTVAITCTFVALAANRTQLTSEEAFRFKGLLQSMLGVLSRPAIRKAHDLQMRAFKRFVEQR